MTTAEFRAALVAVRPRKGSDTAVEGARRVLIDGVTQYRAAKELNISQAAISRMVYRLTHRCQTCGQPTGTKK